jgi:phage/plasmid primase-like uncharacterized protein
MQGPAHELAGRLARDAEAVCRHYLSNGRRNGRYWCVGDVDNTPGRSLFVRLTGPDSGKGAAGQWSDAATGEHGDLLDLIAANRKLASLSDTLEEARSFLRLPRADAVRGHASKSAPQGSPEAARRLWAIARPIRGALAETYLRSRAIVDVRNLAALRFHPRCWYRGDPDDPRDRLRDAWPALIAAVRDNAGTLTGVHRTWLALDGDGKAPVSTPRRAMGQLLGHGVRFGAAGDALVIGEGIETMLSLRDALPCLPAIAALSASHLAAVELPPRIRRLYLAGDDDPAGHGAVNALATRAGAAGIEPVLLQPTRGDWNDDLRAFGIDAVRRALQPQLAAPDRALLLPTG